MWRFRHSGRDAKSAGLSDYSRCAGNANSRCRSNRLIPAYKAELWELVCKKKPGRQNNHEVTLFDSVGFALEDYSILRVVHKLAKEYQLGAELPLIPELSDPKNLFGLLSP